MAKRRCLIAPPWCQQHSRRNALHEDDEENVLKILKDLPSLIPPVEAVVVVDEEVKSEIHRTLASELRSWLHRRPRTQNGQVRAVKAAENHRKMLVKFLRSPSSVESVCGRSEEAVRERSRLHRTAAALRAPQSPPRRHMVMRTAGESRGRLGGRLRGV